MERRAKRDRQLQRIIQESFIACEGLQGLLDLGRRGGSPSKMAEDGNEAPGRLTFGQKCAATVRMLSAVRTHLDTLMEDTEEAQAMLNLKEYSRDLYSERPRSERLYRQRRASQVEPDGGRHNVRVAPKEFGDLEGAEPPVGEPQTSPKSAEADVAPAARRPLLEMLMDETAPTDNAPMSRADVKQASQQRVAWHKHPKHHRSKTASPAAPLRPG